MLNSVVVNRFEEARKDAETVDHLIQSNSIPIETLAKEKPFLGVPFTTKDCIAVKGAISTMDLRCFHVCFYAIFRYDAQCRLGAT